MQIKFKENGESTSEKEARIADTMNDISEIREMLINHVELKKEEIIYCEMNQHRQEEITKNGKDELLEKLKKMEENK